MSHLPPPPPLLLFLPEKEVWHGDQAASLRRWSKNECEVASIGNSAEKSWLLEKFDALPSSVCQSVWWMDALIITRACWPGLDSIKEQHRCLTLDHMDRSLRKSKENISMQLQMLYCYGFFLDHGVLAKSRSTKRTQILLSHFSTSHESHYFNHILYKEEGIKVAMHALPE